MESERIQSTIESARASAKDRDWAADAATTVERVVSMVRDKSTSKVELLAKVLVYGVLAGLLGLVAVVLLLVLVFRLLDIVLPPSDGSWSAWIFFGVIFTLGGAVLWAKRGRLVPPS